MSDITVVVRLATSAGLRPFKAQNARRNGGLLWLGSVEPIGHTAEPTSKRPIRVCDDSGRPTGYGTIWAVAVDGAAVTDAEAALALLPTEQTALDALRALLQGAAAEQPAEQPAAAGQAAAEPAEQPKQAEDPYA